MVVAACLAALVVGIIVARASVSLFNLNVGPNIGTVTTLGLALKDFSGTNTVTSIDWGNITTGSSRSYGPYLLVNTGSADENVTMTNDMSALIGTCTWDAENRTVPYAGSIFIDFTITILPDIPAQGFSFNITIQAI
jgi:hypothetical protein